jgi:hypothetical protein
MPHPRTISGDNGTVRVYHVYGAIWVGATVLLAAIPWHSYYWDDRTEIRCYHNLACTIPMGVVALLGSWWMSQQSEERAWRRFMGALAALWAAGAVLSFALPSSCSAVPS